MTNATRAAPVLLVLLSACVTSETPMRLGMLSTRPVPFSVEVLSRDVEAADCPEAAGEMADYATALDAALKSVPDASVMLNVSLYVRERLTLLPRICAEIRGDAGRIP